jgi:apolipoprotein N-acyltransferase
MRAIVLGASTGMLLVCATPPHALYPLVLIGFLPLLRAAHGRRGCPALGSAAAAGWIAGTVFYLGAADWLPETIAHLQSIGPAAAWALFGFFAVVHALQFALALALAALLGSTAARPAPVRWLANAGGAAAAWVVLEWAFPKVFPWSVGSVLGADPRLRQAAELGGAHGLALLVMLVNALLAEGARRHSPPAQRLCATGAALGLLSLALAYGAWRTPTPRRAGARGGARIAIVQGGAAASDTDPAATAAHSLATYASLTRAAAAASDLVVWPEVALRVYVRDNDFFRDRLAALVREAARPVLLGALDRTANGGELNGAYVFAPALAARPVAVHHKSGLLPFGEYVPGADWWPALRRWRTTGEFVPGTPLVPFDVDLAEGRLRIATAICVEATRPGAFNDAVRRGAELLVNLSDDTWFASEKAAAQHLELTRLRAVETRRWLVRASNSGVSAFIDPAGRVLAALPLGAVGTLVHRIDRGRTITAYVRRGDWVVPLCAVVVCLLGLARLHEDSHPSPQSRWRICARSKP